MPPYANANIGSVTSYSVKVNGDAIPDGLNILSIEVEKMVNRISTARVRLLDGQPDQGTFPASSSGTFVPGAKLSIEAGYDASNATIFEGIITRQSISIDESVGSALEVECRDPAIKMIVGRKSQLFTQQSDSEIISGIIGNYSGLTSEVTSTSTQWPGQVQYYATDWDFILSLAEANGMIVTTLNGKLTVAPPDANTSPVLVAKFGDGLLEFNADLNAITQLSKVSASSWDYKNQELTSGEAGNSYAGPGNLSSSTLAGVVGLSNFQLQTGVPLQSADLTGWSKAQMIKNCYAKVQGEARFPGSSLVDPGNYITLDGLGDRFNGDHLVSGVLHTISDGNWVTTATLGLSPNWFTAEADVIAPPASGLLPGISGLFNGTVKKMYEDPDSQFRIQVDIPLFGANGEGLWARLSNFYSTSGAGAFFLPEVGDEVVMGFLNGDPRCPIILGSLYSNSQRQPYTGLTPNEKNSIKAIVSKSGISVEFDDENKVLTIATPDKNTIILSDKDKQISVKDDNQNSIVLSQDGITMSSPKTISLQADQQIKLSGATGISLQSSGGDVTISGINIKETADSQYSAEGSLTAKINSGTELTLQSAMIMIN